jgi:cation:H+ antiporter
MSLEVTLWNVALLAVGLFLLLAGSEFFVKAAASVAKRMGISEFIIGLTLVAVGTSMPELFSSVTASLKQQGDIVVGNIVGSNIANICLVLGVTASLFIIKTNDEMLKRDGYIMMFAVLIFYVFIFDGSLSVFEAAAFIFLYFAYLGFVFRKKQKYKEQYGFKAFISYLVRLEYLRSTARRITDIKKRSANGSRLEGGVRSGVGPGISRILAVFLISLIAIILGANLLIDEAVYFADLFGISGTLIGLSLIALASSLPELGVTITAARRGFSNIAVGNIMGSCIANILLVLSISTFIYAPSVTDNIKFYFAPMMLFVTALCLLFVRSKWKIRRFEGFAFVALYGAFVLLLVMAP